MWGSSQVMCAIINYRAYIIENVKVQIYETIFLPTSFMVQKFDLSLWRKKKVLKIPKNEVLRKVFGSRGYEVMRNGEN
jgi:hypothetical protein